MEQLTSLAHKELDEFIPASGKDKSVEIVRNSVSSFFIELFEGIHANFRCKFMFQELRVHEFCTSLSFYEQKGLNNILMCEKSQNRGLFIDIPDDNALIIRSTDKSLPIFGNGDPSNPSLMSTESFLAISCTDFPEPDGFVSGAGEDHIAFRVKIDIGDVVVVAIESFEAEVIVIDIPEFDGEVRRARCQVAALVIVVHIVYRIQIRRLVLV